MEMYLALNWKRFVIWIAAANDPEPDYAWGSDLLTFTGGRVNL